MSERSTKARDLMSKRLIVLSPEMDLLRAMQTLLEHGISGAPVVDSRGSLVGILTERDCLTVAVHATYHHEPGGKVADRMTHPVETLPADLDLVGVVERFLRSRYRRFPVLDGTRLVGQISRRDILRALLELW